MVSDVHRTVLYGGVYLYPADKAKVRMAYNQARKSETKMGKHIDNVNVAKYRRLYNCCSKSYTCSVCFAQGTGKLRILYEGFPMAMIMEQGWQLLTQWHYSA